MPTQSISTSNNTHKRIQGYRHCTLQALSGLQGNTRNSDQLGGCHLLAPGRWVPGPLLLLHKNSVLP